MEGKSFRILVVDDYEPWRRFASTTIQKQSALQVIGEASDGLEAAQKAQELQPDLILLDIGLPRLNGIEAARRIRELSPKSRILFVSENRSPDIVEAALSTGAEGYVVKAEAGKELLPALEAVLEDKRFVSAGLAGHDLAFSSANQSDKHFQRKKVVAPFPERKIRHEVAFYANDAGFLDGFAHFIEAALKVRNAVIVVASESHQASLFQRLVADGLNVAAEIEQGSYLPLEVADTLSRFMVDDSPDSVLFVKLAGDLIMAAARGANGKQRRVVACGEGVHVLLAGGNLEATLKLERMWDEIARHYEVDILCAYFRSAFASEESISTLDRVCAEHSAVRGRELLLG